jgi:hypothetical protein
MTSHQGWDKNEDKSRFPLLWLKQSFSRQLGVMLQ